LTTIGKDQAFIDKSDEALGGYPLVSGENVEGDLKKAFTISDAVRQYTIDLLAEKYDVEIETK
jgi:hypothetical protein